MRRFLVLAVPALLGFTALGCGAKNDDPSTSELTAALGGAPVLVGVNSSGLSEYKSATGLVAQEVRVYLEQGKSIPSSVAAANLNQYYSAGQAVVYSMKVDDSPDSEATNKANLSALAKDIVAKGHASKTWIVLHHEPYPELSGSAFQAMYSTYAPSVRSAGVRCGVIYQTYPLYHGQPDYAPDYTAGILDIVDFIGIDEYPSAAPGGYTTDILADISPFTTYAKSNGKRFQINEVAIDSKVSGTQEAQAAWLSGLKDLGSSVEVISYFESSSFPNLQLGNDPDAVTAWKNLVTLASK